MDPWLDSWTNFVNIAKYHSDPSKFIGDFLRMERIPEDITNTRKEGSPEANKKMDEFFDMAKEHNLGFLVGDFIMSDCAAIVDMYEHGSGFKNVPDQVAHLIDPVTMRPKGVPGSPYIGYGWYVKHISEITSDTVIDMDHILANPLEDIMKIYIVFSERKSTACRPCEPLAPQYIGFCK